MHLSRGRQVLLALLITLLVGASPVIFERILSAGSNRLSGIQPLDQVLGSLKGSLPEEELESINKMIRQKNVIDMEGFVFYPRQQRANQVNPIPSLLLEARPEKVLFFYLVREKKYETAYFPFDENFEVEDKEIVYVVGCRTSGAILVSNLVILGEDQQITAYHSDLGIKLCD
jgi:hypothetical protein